MIYNNFEELTISKITLGTAQLGMKYGIANKVGEMSENQSNTILEHAILNGINCFDTASAYGDSEKRLGKFFDQNKIKKKPIVITKIPKISSEQSFTEVFQDFKKSIVKSKINLGIEKIPICLLHEPFEISNHDFGVQSLIKLKKEGLVNHIGISSYHPSEVIDYLEIEEFDVIQIPINVFDNRLLINGLLSELNENKKLIFGRSVFLQGLIGMQISSIPTFLENVKKYLIEFKEICNEYNMNEREVAFLYVREIDEIASMIIGVETDSQLEENLNFIKKSKLPNSLVDKIKEKFVELPEEIINPSLWRNN